MMIAEKVAQGRAVPGDRVWPHLQDWARELGLTGAEAVTQAREVSGRYQARGPTADLARSRSAGCTVPTLSRPRWIGWPGRALLRCVSSRPSSPGPATSA